MTLRQLTRPYTKVIAVRSRLASLLAAVSPALILGLAVTAPGPASAAEVCPGGAPLEMKTTLTGENSNSFDPCVLNAYVTNEGKLINYGTLINFDNPETRGNTVTNAGMVINYGSLENDSQLNNNYGAELTNVGTLTNASGHVLENSGSLTNNAGAMLTNAGRLTNTAGATLTNDGQVVNSGTFDVQTGSILDGTGTFSQTGGVTKVNGTMTQSAVDISGGELQGAVTITASVTLSGTGTLAPGNSVGTLNIIGGLLMTGGTLEIGITGKGAGEYDVLNISGAADFTGGILKLGFGGYGPQLGDVFTVLTATDGISGFELLTLQVLGLPTGYSFEIGADGTITTVSVGEPVPLPAAGWLFLSGAVALVGMQRHGSRHVTAQRRGGRSSP